MAYLNRIIKFDGLPISESINATTQGSVVLMGERKMFAISVSAKAYVNFDSADTLTVDATDILLPGAGMYTLQMPQNKSYLSLYNPGGSAIKTSVAGIANC